MQTIDYIPIIVQLPELAEQDVGVETLPFQGSLINFHHDGGVKLTNSLDCPCDHLGLISFNIHLDEITPSIHLLNKRIEFIELNSFTFNKMGGSYISI